MNPSYMQCMRYMKTKLVKQFFQWMHQMQLIQLTEMSSCIMLLFPAIAIYVKNCYSLHSRLFIIGGNEIRSCEGTTQGDTIAMAVYAVAIIPVIL